MKLFTPGKIGPVELRNRTIRSAAFEGMGKDNNPTAALRDYHLSVARGGVRDDHTSLRRNLPFGPVVRHSAMAPA